MKVNWRRVFWTVFGLTAFSLHMPYLLITKDAGVITCVLWFVGVHAAQWCFFKAYEER